MSWLEISLTVPNGELAEAVAEVLGRYLPECVLVQAPGGELDSDSDEWASVPYRVSGYIPENDQLERTRDKIERALWHLGRIRLLPAPEYNPLQEASWVESWKQHYKPIRIGKRLTILPIWEENPDPLRIPIRIDPGLAFGTGTHPSTQLVLELIEASGAAAGRRVLDIGCGSGILSIAAAKFGAQQVLGVDVDPLAVENARRNAGANEVADRTRFEIGSVEHLLRDEVAFGPAGLLVANILVHILIRLMDEGMAELVVPGGPLLLSGILEEREAEFTAALQRNGLAVIERRQMGDWVGFWVSRPGPSQAFAPRTDRL